MSSDDNPAADPTGIDIDPTIDENSVHHPRIWPPQLQNATDSKSRRFTLPPPNPPTRNGYGARTPNGLRWAHTPRDFYRVILSPWDAEPAIWSRSMIQEAWGEDAFDYELGKGKGKQKEGECEIQTPRIMKPWSVLKLCTHRHRHRPGGSRISEADMEECRDLVRWAIDQKCIDELCSIINFPFFRRMRAEIEGMLNATATNTISEVGGMGEEIENGHGELDGASGGALLEKKIDDGETQNVTMLDSEVDMVRGIADANGGEAGSVLVKSGDGDRIVSSAGADGGGEGMNNDDETENVRMLDSEDVGKGADANGGEEEGTKMRSEGRNVEGGVDATGSCLVKSGEVDGAVSSAGADVEMDGEGEGTKNGVIDGDNMQPMNAENEDVDVGSVDMGSNANGGEEEGTEGHNVLSVEGTISNGSCSGSVLANRGEVDGTMSSAGNVGGADVEMDGEGEGMKNGVIGDIIEVAKHVDMKIDDKGECDMVPVESKPEDFSGNKADDGETENVTALEVDMGIADANGGEGTTMARNVEGGVDTTTGSCSGSALVESDEVEPEGGADVEMIEAKGMKNGHVDVAEHLQNANDSVDMKIDNEGKGYQHVNVTGDGPMSENDHPKEQVSNPTKTVEVNAIVNGVATDELDGVSEKGGPLNAGPIPKPEDKKADDDEIVNVENVTMPEDIGKARVAVESNANGGEGTKMGRNVEGGVDITAGSCSGSVLVERGEVDGAVSSAGNEPEGDADVEMDGEGKRMKTDAAKYLQDAKDNMDMKIDDGGKGSMVERVDQHVNVTGDDPYYETSHKDPENDLPKKQVSNPAKTDSLVEAASEDDVQSTEVESDVPPETTLHWKRKDQIFSVLNTFNQRWRRLRSANPDITSIICDGGEGFELQDVPKLEEWIPEKYLPETLIVHDPNHVSSFVESRSKLKKYRRLFPRPAVRLSTGGENSQVSTSTAMPDGDADPFTPATQLYLSESARLGSGNHSYVYRAVLQLPPPLTARDSPNGEVTVAAKLSTYQKEDRALLKNEGMMYARFEKHLAEDWCGFNIFEGEEGLVRPCAVVPKFYGYYVSEEHHGDKRDSAILLLEECGTPVEPEQLTRSQRVEMYSLYRLLHHAKVLQMSTYIRNMVVQPGPLTVSPSQRSMETPSFRIIDFGRGDVIRSNYNDGDIQYEQKKALRELLL